MKKLILIGGPKNSGKRAVSEILNQKLDQTIILNADQNKEMTIKDIQDLLNTYIQDSNVKHIVFCGILDEQVIIDELLSRLNLNGVKIIPVSLLPSIQKLTSNFQNDVSNGPISPDELKHSIECLLKYQPLRTIKYDNSQMSPEETATEIMTQI